MYRFEHIDGLGLSTSAGFSEDALEIGACGRREGSLMLSACDPKRTNARAALLDSTWWFSPELLSG
jgi:hypothetical protein